MATLTIRGINDALYKRLKIAATIEGETLKEWCIAACLEPLPKDVGESPLDASRFTFEGEEAELPISPDPNVHIIQGPIIPHSKNCKCSICKPPK